MNKPAVGQTISLNIHGLGSSGEGVGAIDGFTVFVDGALPGEMVEAKVVQSHKRYGSARLLSIIKPSPDRVTPLCKLFGQCGGCQIMHLSYSKQLEIKRQKVVEALIRIGKISGCEVAPCMASPSSFFYRNKIQVPVRAGKNGVQIGLYARSSHDLVEMDTCAIHCPLGDQIYQKIKDSVKYFNILPYDPATKEGELRHLLIKTAVHTGEVLVIFVTNQKKSPLLSKIAKAVMACSSVIKGVIHNLHRGEDNIILGSIYQTLEGASFIQESLCGLRFKVSPASFFQVNVDQAEFLYLKALEYAEIEGDETVLDAYCGVGTLSLLFAKSAKKVIGVECVVEAIEDALENRRLNSIDNAEFVCASAESFIASLYQVRSQTENVDPAKAQKIDDPRKLSRRFKSPCMAESGLSSVDVILLNPPRKGCELLFLEGIGRLQPKRLVYISCDPATLARDLAHLIRFGYRLDAIQPFDMFPQTAHVECVAKLTYCPT